MAAVSAALPDATVIVQKLARASSDLALLQARNAVAYDRESRVDYVNDDGALKKQVVRRYVIEPKDGRPLTRLVSVNGKAATEKDDEHRSQARETGEKSRTLSLSEDVLAHYDFTCIGEELLNGRKSWMLRLKAKPNPPNDAFMDRLINAMAGVIWVDADENQLAKAELYLARKVSFFGGIAGTIERLDLTLVQRRVEPNVWLGETTFIDFSGRKLFSGIRFRCYETCSNFHNVFPAAGSAASARASAP